MIEDLDDGYRKYLEKQGDNMYAKFALKLLDKGLSTTVPQVVSPELMEKYYAAGVIRKEDLKKGSYYWGTCRNASLAMWTGNRFVHLRTKFASTYAEEINHIEDDDGFDVFLPIQELKFEEDMT